jgi:ubiquitin-conjugating enzyme E2 D/E
MRGRGNVGRGRGGASRVAPVAGRQALRTQLLANKPNSMKRLMRDLKELKEQEVPLVGVAAAPLDDSIYTWHGNLRAPADSVYAGGVFHIEMKFPKEYPDRAPNITLLGYQLDHPNVFGSKLCLDMLETARSKSWYEGWNSAYTVESVLIQLQSFLLDKPKPKKGVSKEDAEEQYKAIVDQANSYKCSCCKHRGPIEPYPPFNDKETDLNSFIVVRDPKQMLADQMVCYHSKASLQDSTLGIGVSLSRLPRTGEIRSVTPQLDLLSLRSFTKQSIRRSIAGEKFTHWLPLYFGESEPFTKTSQIYNEKKKEYENRVEKINPKERAIHLLKKSMSFLTMKNTRKPFTAEMVVEVMPKLMITHLVNMVEGERTHISIQAIRRFFNFVRLFRLLIELQPEAEKIIDQKIKTFIDEPEKRVKDHCSSLGDMLSFAIVSNKYKIEDVLDAYLSEQLDRQAFWIIRQIPELDHTDEKYKGKEVVLEESRNEVCFKTGLTGFNITMICYSIDELLQTKFGGNLDKLSQDLDSNFGCLQEQTEDALQQTLKAMKKVDNFNKYYTWVKRSCPDAKALQLRLRDAITNSKMKRYHGSAEHMNILPTMKTQATDHLLADPSPFVHFDESKSSFTKGEKDPFWRDAVLRKFEWVKIFLKNHLNEDVAAVVATEADRREMEPENQKIHI